MSNIHIEYCFHPVGQGTFASGRIKYGSKSFNWVYDCGSTNSSRKFLNSAISDYSESNIDMLFISHFDYDHISGLSQLMQNRNVRCVILPYLHYWQRILIATSALIDHADPLFGFYQNPVGFIKAALGDSVEIIFVGNRSDQSFVVSEDPKTFEPLVLNSNKQEGFSIRIENSEKLVDKRILARDGKILISIAKTDVFEFMPYNVENDFDYIDQGLLEFIAEFFRAGYLDFREVRDLVDDILNSKKSSGIRKTRSRNIQSMFLWAGPYFECEDIFFSCFQNQKKAILYTGDGYLTTTQQLCDLMQYLDFRAQKIVCLQVMHHGSRQNCSRQVRELINPSWAVFCARRAEYGHPHAEVEEYFAGCSLLADHQQMISLALESNGSGRCIMEKKNVSIK